MDPASRILVLTLGGALGVNARYWLGLAIGRWAPPGFPWATVLINVSGSFAIGLGAVLLAARWPSPLVRLFLVTGFLGGYTTFSSFAFESFDLWERGERSLSAANAVGSVAAGLLAVVLGVGLGRAIVGDGPGIVRGAEGVVERPESVELAPPPLLDREVEDG